MSAVPNPTWTSAPLPGIASLPANVARALKNACRAVDHDVELLGGVTAETVDKVRAALSLVRATA